MSTRRAADRQEPGFFGKLFSFGAAAARRPAAGALPRQRQVGGPASTVVSVLDAKGAPENGDIGKRIVRLLVDELK